MSTKRPFPDGSARPAPADRGASYAMERLLAQPGPSMRRTKCATSRSRSRPSTLSTSPSACESATHSARLHPWHPCSKHQCASSWRRDQYLRPAHSCSGDLPGRGKTGAAPAGKFHLAASTPDRATSSERLNTAQLSLSPRQTHILFPRPRRRPLPPASL